MKWIFSVYIIFNWSIMPNHVTKDVNKIKEVWVYDYFVDKGFTNNSAYSQFKVFEDENIVHFRLDETDEEAFIYILTQAKQKKLFPGKTGQNVLFAQIVTTDNKHSKLLISKTLIRDFTSHRDYWITSIEQQDWLSKMIVRIKKNNE